MVRYLSAKVGQCYSLGLVAMAVNGEVLHLLFQSPEQLVSVSASLCINEVGDCPEVSDQLRDLGLESRQCFDGCTQDSDNVVLQDVRL